MKPREQRIRVVLPARMGWEGRWAAATVCNLSSRGLMIRSASLPPRGAYVEVELPTGTVTARAVWTRGAHCGLHAREKLNTDALLAPGRARAARQKRAAPTAAPARSAGRSLTVERQTSAALQFVSIAAAAALAAAGVAWTLYDTLAAPVSVISGSMVGE